MLVIANYVIACPSVKSRGVQWWQGSTWPNDCRDAIIPARNLGQLCWYFYNTCTWWWYLLILVPARNLGQLSALPTGHHIISFHPSLQNCAEQLLRDVKQQVDMIAETGGTSLLSDLWGDLWSCKFSTGQNHSKISTGKEEAKLIYFAHCTITHLLTDLSKLWQESCHPDSQWSPITINHMKRRTYLCGSICDKTIKNCSETWEKNCTWPPSTLVLCPSQCSITYKSD